MHTLPFARPPSASPCGVSGTSQCPTPSQQPCPRQVSSVRPRLPGAGGRTRQAAEGLTHPSCGPARPSQTFPGRGELAACGATLFPREMIFPAVVADVLRMSSVLALQRCFFIFQVNNFLGRCVCRGSPSERRLSRSVGRWDAHPCLWMSLQGLGASGAVMVPKGRAALSRRSHASPSWDVAARALLDPVKCNESSAPWRASGL